MFKKLVPIVSLLLLAGPVFAQDTTAQAASPGTDHESHAPSKKATKATKTTKTTRTGKTATGADASAPK